MGVVRVKDGVLFNVIAPGGFRILGGIDSASKMLDHDLVLTSGTDGEHSGPNDPHHRGEAYDVRCHDLPDKQKALDAIMFDLSWSQFYAFIEAEGTENEHIHIQVKKGTTYP